MTGTLSGRSVDGTLEGLCETSRPQFHSTFCRHVQKTLIFETRRIMLKLFQSMRELNPVLIKCVVVLAGFLSHIIPVQSAATYIANPGNYLSRLRTLHPGDSLQLMSGDYRAGLPVHNLRGTPEAPITISGPEDGPRPVLIARPGHNTVSIINSSHVIVRNLDLDGQNLPVDGVKCEGHADWAHHIILEGLRITGHGNNQQTVGISTKCPAWGWLIRNNLIARAGTGLYLGNSDGRAPFIAGVIEYNLIVDTRGYNLQIKHQEKRPELPDIPDRPGATIIRHNVFSKASGGSEKEMARPNVLVGHWPLAGPGSSDRYLVYGNFFYENPHESLFQGEGNIALYNNLFVNRSGDAIRIQPHNGSPREISVFYNTVLSRGAGITLARREHDSAYPQFVFANIVFAHAPIRGASLAKNLTGGFDDAEKYLARPFARLGELNLTATGVPALGPAQRTAGFETYPGAQQDFDGSSYSGSRIGAYMAGKSRPRWMPALQIKPPPVMR
jgi:hypothetical protein